MAKGVFGVALSEGEIERLFRSIDLATFTGRRDEALYRVILETGMLARDALRLKLGDVDNVPGLREVLGDYLAYNSTLTAPGPEGFLFPPLDQRRPKGPIKIVPGKGIKIRGALKSLHAWVKWAGLDQHRVTFMSLRYTGAARLIERGASRKEVGKFLHGNGTTASRVYLRLKGVSRADPGVQGGHPGPLVRRPRGGQRRESVFGSGDIWYEMSTYGFSYGSPKHIPLELWPELRPVLRDLLGEVLRMPYKTHMDGVKLALKAVEIGRALANGQARWVEEQQMLKYEADLEARGERNPKWLTSHRSRLDRFRYHQKKSYAQWLDMLVTACDTKLGREVLFYYWKNGELDYLLPEHLQRGQFPEEWE